MTPCASCKRGLVREPEALCRGCALKAAPRLKVHREKHAPSTWKPRVPLWVEVEEYAIGKPPPGPPRPRPCGGCKRLVGAGERCGRCAATAKRSAAARRLVRPARRLVPGGEAVAPKIARSGWKPAVPLWIEVEEYVIGKPPPGPPKPRPCGGCKRLVGAGERCGRCAAKAKRSAASRRLARPARRLVPGGKAVAPKIARSGWKPAVPLWIEVEEYAIGKPPPGPRLPRPCATCKRLVASGERCGRCAEKTERSAAGQRLARPARRLVLPESKAVAKTIAPSKWKPAVPLWIEVEEYAIGKPPPGPRHPRPCGTCKRLVASGERCGRCAEKTERSAAGQRLARPARRLVLPESKAVAKTIAPSKWKPAVPLWIEVEEYAIGKPPPGPRRPRPCATCKRLVATGERCGRCAEKAERSAAGQRLARPARRLVPRSRAVAKKIARSDWKPKVPLWIEEARLPAERDRRNTYRLT